MMHWASRGNTATRAISSGSPTLPSGLIAPARSKNASRSVTPDARATSIWRSVRIAPGSSELTRIVGASSLESVLARPLTPPRMLLLNVSPLIGCLTLVDVMKRIAPASDLRNAGNAA